MTRNGNRGRPGELNGNSKLRASDISIIKALRAGGLSTIELGEMFGVHHNTIWNVCSGVGWQTVDITQVEKGIELRFWSKVLKGEGCWLWTKSTSGGYGDIMVNRKPVKTHRLAYELTYGPIPNGLSVLHKCDNPTCVRPDHLFLGTQLDNMRDCASKGRLRQQKRRPMTLDSVAKALGVDDGHDNFRISGSVKRGHPAEVEITITEVMEKRRSE